MKPLQRLFGLGVVALASCGAAYAQVNTTDPRDTPDVRNHQQAADPSAQGPHGLKGLRHHGRQRDNDRGGYDSTANDRSSSGSGMNEDLSGTVVSENEAQQKCDVLSNANKRSDCMARVNDENGAPMSRSSMSDDRSRGMRDTPAPVQETPGRVLRGRKP